MKNKVVKITLEKILEVLLSHGVQSHKVEGMMDLGVPEHYIESTSEHNFFEEN